MQKWQKPLESGSVKSTYYFLDTCGCQKGNHDPNQERNPKRAQNPQPGPGNHAYKFQYYKDDGQKTRDTKWNVHIHLIAKNSLQIWFSQKWTKRKPGVYPGFNDVYDVSKKTRHIDGSQRMAEEVGLDPKSVPRSKGLASPVHHLMKSSSISLFIPYPHKVVNTQLSQEYFNSTCANCSAVKLYGRNAMNL